MIRTEIRTGPRRTEILDLFSRLAAVRVSERADGLLSMAGR